MPTTATATVRVDRETLARLRALAALIGRPVADVTRTLSHASLGEVLQCTANRGAAERQTGA